MDRLACISVSSLPLQIALRRFPEGHSEPLVLVKEDKPTSVIQHLNRAAKEQGLRVGMRYSEALSIVCDVKAVTVSPNDVAEARQEILQVLKRWSPLVEVCPFDGASFWVGTTGLSGLYGTEAQWGTGVRSALANHRYRAIVAVGLTRGGTYVLSRTRRTSTVVQSAEAERRALNQAPLELFPLQRRSRRLLGRLGLRTLADVLAIPTEELSRHLGPDLVQELRRLEELNTLPLQGEFEVPETLRAKRWEGGITDRQALVVLLEELLVDGLEELGRRGRLLAELRLVLLLETGDLVNEVLRPADPTLNASLLIRLLELRLARTLLPTAVVELRIAFLDVPLPPSSGELFAPAVQRDLRRGSEALALVRAQWGNACVVRAVLVDNHSPERSFRWEPLEQLTLPRASQPQNQLPTAIRRVALRSGSFSGSSSANPSGQRLGRSWRLKVVWGAQEVDKEYSFLRNGRREVAWVSWDRLTAQPCWEGVVD